MLERLANLVILALLTAFFSVGWFGLLAVIEDAVPVGGIVTWSVGLVFGSVMFGVFVTMLREGGSSQVRRTLVGR